MPAVKDKIAELTRSALEQVERVRVMACRIVLDQAPRSRTVDYHALRILLTHLSARDIEFLVRSLGPARVKLDQNRPSADPTFFGRMLWILALDRRWPEPMLRRVQYFCRDSSFEMELDLARAPECMYYAEDPTPSLTRLLRLGGDVFFDVGANVGFYSLTGSMFFRQSHAFEPTPQTLHRLRRNIALNSNRKVTAHGVALSSQDGQASLVVDEVHPGGNSLTPHDPSKDSDTIHVPAFRLDTFRRAHGLPGPDLIKIDVEGHEYDVLVGAEETVETFRPTIFVEVQSMEILERFARRLPPEYQAFILPSTGAPIPASLRGKLGTHHDVLFVDAVKRGGVLDRLAESSNAVPHLRM